MLWSSAVYHLGLTSEQFFELTPRQFSSLMKRKEEQDTRLEMLVGVNTSVLANHSANPPETAYMPETFMPCMWGKKSSDLSEQELAQKIRRSFTKLPPGSVIYKTLQDE